MCGRYALSALPETMAALFGLGSIPVFRPRYNIAPTQEAPIIRATPTGERRMDLLRWGLVPFWAKDPTLGHKMINARVETAADTPAFRAAYRKRRCLVPASGFYEWQKVGKKKQPYLVRMKDGAPFGLAGLWERWKDNEGDAIESYTILTREPNDVVRPLYDRMPVIVAPEYFDLWLDPKVEDVERLETAIGPVPAAAMEAIPVSTRVNSVANDDPECSKPLSPRDLETIERDLF